MRGRDLHAWSSSALSVSSSLSGLSSSKASATAFFRSPLRSTLESCCSFRIVASSSSALASSTWLVTSFHTFSTPSDPPVAILSPQGRAATAQARSLCPSSVASHSLLRMVQILRRPSAPEDASCRPLRRKQTLSTEAVWPWNALRQLPSPRCQRRTVRSPLLEASALSIGLNLTHHTPRRWPLSVSASVPSRLHTRTNLSCPAVAIISSFGATARPFTSLSCARMLHDAVSEAASSAPPPPRAGRSKSLSVLSLPPLTTNAPPLP